jgi:hypothetical protein
MRAPAPCLLFPPYSCPDSVDLYLEDTEVSKLFLYYEDAIKQIFQFYASQAEIRTKGEGSPRKGGVGALNTMKEALGCVVCVCVCVCVGGGCFRDSECTLGVGLW